MNDIMWELAEFALELLQESQTQLSYHRASAYKTETSRKLQAALDQVRSLFEILNDDFLLDLLQDLEAIELNARQTSECSITAKILHLITHAAPALNQYQKKVLRNRKPLNEETVKNILVRKRALLAVCKQGSRSWELLKSL